jgi:hypothetical protein
MAVAYLFANLYDALEEDLDKWTGNWKIHTKIRETLCIPEETELCDIFRAVLFCKNVGIHSYIGQQHVGLNMRFGQPPAIAQDLAKAQIVAGSMEDGLSVPDAWRQ